MVIDRLAVLEVLPVDVIEPLIPSLKAFTLQGYDLLAESTPETTLAISTDAVFLTLIPYDLVALDRMRLFKVGLKLFPAIEYLGALLDFAAEFCFMAAPSLNLVVSSILMPFPVILTPEGLGTGGKGAAIRTGVTLLVFPKVPSDWTIGRS